LLRCFIGGSRNEKLLDASDDELLNIVSEDLGQIIGLTARPVFTRIYRWRRAMAQYDVGHLERLERIGTLLRQLPGLALAGNGYRGIGVPDSVRTGTEAAQKCLTTLGMTSETPQKTAAI
jgi:oxygen-dependent protoporphyrinogen oxidase